MSGGPPVWAFDPHRGTRWRALRLICARAALAIELNGQVTVYDTRDHAIGGASQQQSSGGTLSFTSQHGLIDPVSLPVVSAAGEALADLQSPRTMDAATTERPQSPASDVFGTIERLASRKEEGFLTDEEFGAKKVELLSRL